MSNTHAISLKRSTTLLAAIAFMAMLMVVNVASFFGTASAAQLSNRSLTLSSSIPGDETGDGVANSETNGASARHSFDFTTLTLGNTSTTFTYCTTAIGAGSSPNGSGCTAPTGLVIPATPTTTGGGSAAVGTNANQIVWTNSYGATQVTPAFAGITNPTSVGTFFVRITANGGDEGTVASAITEGIQITSRVRETLGFSTTGAINDTNVGDPGSACDPVTGSGVIQIGDPVENTLDINSTYYGESAFRIYTNAANGAAVQYQGESLTKGSDIINPIGAGDGVAVASAAGTEQFGLGVDLTASTLGADYANFSSAATLDGAEAGELVFDADYSQADAVNDAFAFEAAPGARTVATSNNNSYLDCATALVRYVANIDPLTPAGTYTTTIVYSAVPTY